MVLPVLGAAAGGVATAAARGAIGGIASGLASGITGAVSGQQNTQSQPSPTTSQPSNETVVTRTPPAEQLKTSSGQSAAVVDRIDSLSKSSGGSTKQVEDTGLRLTGGAGTVPYLLGTVISRLDSLIAVVSSQGRGGRGGEVTVTQRGQSSERSADITGLLAGLGLTALGEAIQAIANSIDRIRQRMEGAGERANEQAATGREQLSERQRAGAGPGQVMAQNLAQSRNVNNEELANIQETLETPEEGESEAQRTVRESLNRRLDEVMSSETLAGGGLNIPPEINQYLDDRRQRTQERQQQRNTMLESVNAAEAASGITPPSEVPLMPTNEAPAGATQITPPTTPGPGLIGRAQARATGVQQEQTQPTARQNPFSQIWNTITGRDMDQQRRSDTFTRSNRSLASSLDEEMNIPNLPPQNQTPTIINNNNIIQGGGGGGSSPPSTSAATGSAAPPAGTTPPSISPAPIPPNSPAFFP